MSSRILTVDTDLLNKTFALRVKIIIRTKKPHRWLLTKSVVKACLVALWPCKSQMEVVRTMQGIWWWTQLRMVSACYHTSPQLMTIPRTVEPLHHALLQAEEPIQQLLVWWRRHPQPFHSKASLLGAWQANFLHRQPSTQSKDRHPFSTQETIN